MASNKLPPGAPGSTWDNPIGIHLWELWARKQPRTLTAEQQVAMDACLLAGIDPPTDRIVKHSRYMLVARSRTSPAYYARSWPGSVSVHTRDLTAAFNFRLGPGPASNIAFLEPSLADLQEYELVHYTVLDSLYPTLTTKPWLTSLERWAARWDS